MQANDAGKHPTRSRMIVGFWLCSMAAILYLDRVCWAKAAPSIKAEFGLTNTHLSYLAMAFQLAYGLFEIPTGRWGEMIGARRVLTRITIWWSIFTALTGAGLGFGSLLIVRFLFGVGEAGAYPNAARVLTRWFPKHERGRMQGIMLSVSLFGGAIAPTLAAVLIEVVGWRWTFVLFGSLGCFWAAGFWIWFRDTPDEHRSVNALELSLIRTGGATVTQTNRDPVPWRHVLVNPGILILSLIIMCSSFNSYFYFTWFSSYLESAHEISNTKSGVLTSLALFGAALGVLSGGVIADRMMRRSAAIVFRRRVFCSCAYLLSATALFFAVRTESVVGMSCLAAMSCFFVQLTLPIWWSAAIEQSGEHVGPLFGLMNMMGTIGALASQWFVGVFADWQADRGLTGREQWDPMFAIYVGVLVTGSLGWMLYRKRPIEVAMTL
ncbi:MAG: MFS transporter [Pirellulaceae bacterium]|nr:MFS transporter [Pirellulaceae bacterium]